MTSTTGVPRTRPQSSTSGEVLYEARELNKSFGAVRALDHASIQVERGEVHALVGDNGAGKSTFVRALTGVHQPDSGELLFKGKPVTLRRPNDSRRLGIETVYQDLALIEDLTVWQNLFLDRELIRGGFLRRKAMRSESKEIIDRLDVNVPSVTATVRRMSGGQRQSIAIARAVNWGSEMVIMDEPTAALGVRETAAVERLIGKLRQDGIAVLIISHDLQQVLRCADRVTVLRRGSDVATRNVDTVSGDELVGLITGTVSGDRANQ